MKLAPALVICSLVLPACSRASSDAADAAPALDATPVAAAALDAAVAAADAGPAKPTSACAYLLEAPAATIEKAPDADIARAVIPTLNEKAMTVKAGSDGNVVDCLGDKASSDWGGAPHSTAKGKVIVAQRQPLTNNRELVWVMTGWPGAMCGTEDGFLAMVHLENGYVVADGVGHWQHACGDIAKLRVAKLGGHEVYLDDTVTDSDGSHSTSEEIWVLHDGHMVDAGGYETLRSLHDDGMGEPWIVGMSSKTELTGSDVILQEMWTWKSNNLKDGAVPVIKQKTNDRKFTLEGAKLKHVSPDGDPAMPK